MVHTEPVLRQDDARVQQKAESLWTLATVKWFNRVRGYGFVQTEGCTSDLFVHMVTVRKSGFTDLTEGQRVDVRWRHGQKGLYVVALRPVA